MKAKQIQKDDVRTYSYFTVHLYITVTSHTCIKMPTPKKNEKLMQTGGDQLVSMHDHDGAVGLRQHKQLALALEADQTTQ